LAFFYVKIIVDIRILFAKMDLPSVVAYVLKMLNDQLPKQYLYHNITHTLNVHDMTMFYSNEIHLSQSDSDLVCTAAILHDVGYIIQYIDNEPHAVAIANKLLPDFGYSSNQIEIVAGCIMATCLPQKAMNELQMIVCDADLDYLGRDDYFEIADNLRNEWLTQGIALSVADWQEMQINFLTHHTYYTEAAQKLRGEKKIQNLNKLLIQ